MKISAIICEYNPLHNGHEAHIRATRELTSCDAVIAVMSGNFVQRGEAAAFDKHTRAAAAIHAGADMVVELPTAAAISGADSFSLTSVRMLNGIEGVQYLSFGSESGSIADLEQLAQHLVEEPESVKQLIGENLKSGMSFPSARAKAYEQVLGADMGALLSSPNNVLGLEYLKALRLTSSKIKPITIKRIGADYHDPDYNKGYPSATAIRQALAANELNVLDHAVPVNAARLYQQAFDHSQFLARESKLYDLIRYRLFTCSEPLSLSNIADITEGLEHKIFGARIETDYKSFLNAIKSKRYTMARIKRIVLNILLGITQDVAADLKVAPLYYNILAIKKDKKSDLLSLLKTNRLTRRTDHNLIADHRTLHLVELNILADEIYSIISGLLAGRFFGTGMLTI